MNIASVLFHGSSLSLKKITSVYKTYSYNILNTSFLGCNFSAVLSIQGEMNVTLDTVTVNATQSQHVIHSTKKSSLFIEGHCCFYNNKGAIVITQSELIISKATVVFVNNTCLLYTSDAADE